jgi:hypothetical protein
VAEAVLGLEHVCRRIDRLQAAAELVDGLVGIGAEQLPPVHVIGVADRRVDAEHS